MAILKDEVKVFIVQALACFDTPSQVVEAVAENFSVKIDRMHVQKYDPTKRAGVDLAKKYVTLFHETRRKFMDEVSEVPIASRAFRLRALQSMYNSAIKRNNIVLAKDILTEAAKEVGDFYVNKKLTNNDDTNLIMTMFAQVGGNSLPIVKPEPGGRLIEQEDED